MKIAMVAPPVSWYSPTKHSLLQFLLCLFSLQPCLVSADTFYVRPNASVSCPQPCRTLSEYADQPPDVSNVTMLFIEGEHSLSRNFSLSNVNTISLITAPDNSMEVTVSCSYDGRFAFENATSVLFSNLNMLGCYGNDLTYIDTLTIENLYIEGLLNNSQGKAVFHTEAVESFTVVDCVFTMNQATAHGPIGCSVFSIWNSKVTIVSSEFEHNQAQSVHSGEYPLASTLCFFGSKVTIEGSNFTNNSASTGGVLYAERSQITASETSFINNRAAYFGGVAFLISDSEFTLKTTESFFIHNSANKSGGCVHAVNSRLHILVSTIFESNTARSGGALTLRNRSTVQINHNLHQNFRCNGDSMVKFTNNSAQFGGALHAIEDSVVYVRCSTFESNHYRTQCEKQCHGGVILVRSNTTISLIDTSFYGNHANVKGGILFAQFARIKSSGRLDIHHNEGALYMTNSTANFTGQLSFINNRQSFWAHYSDITFSGETTFANCIPINVEEVGAITATRSTLTIHGSFTVRNNQGENGGAMRLIESVLDVYGLCTFYNNSATNDGGAMNAYRSTLKFKGNVTFRSNEATRYGGAFYLGRSTIQYSSGLLSFLDNRAQFGGAIYFERSSTLYILKETMECKIEEWYCVQNPQEWLQLSFTGNSAHKGGALYVNDYAAISCFSDDSHVHDECFIQTVAVYVSAYDWNTTAANLSNIDFTDNVAYESGSVLYGGLLDRCAVDKFAELKQIRNVTNGLSYFKELSVADILDTDITSDPVRVCLCDDNFEVNCVRDMTIPNKTIKRGKTFSLNLAVVDQTGTPIANDNESTVHAYLSSVSSRLKDGQSKQKIAIDKNCTQLEFAVYASHQSENLTLYAEGPCLYYGISKIEVSLDIDANCPIGFSLSESSLECVCSPELKDHVMDCSMETESVVRRGNVWISSSLDDNNTNNTGIIVHEYCPYDYCDENESISVNLNDENGSDAQCAFNRTGCLCGCCDRKANYSLTLGGSECHKCTNYWLFLIIPFGLAGIALVLLMMVCNLTLAAGTLNGLLFYANILIANRFVIFPHQHSVLAVFVSWLGINLGIATCFYNGLDAFAKMWLQIAFEVYLIVLVLVVILMGRSVKISTFFHKCNLYPVHTLATLIMLSYEKLSRKVFSLFAFITLHYTNDTVASPRVWLMDPCLKYMEGKHISLAVVGFIIIITGVVFNFMLLCNKLLIAKCRSVYFITFMEAYHAPFKPNHQYWVGLLLLIRNVSYFMSDFWNAGENPDRSLHFIFALVMGLLLIKFFYVSMSSLKHISLEGLKRRVLCREYVREEPEVPNEFDKETGIVYRNPYIDFLETSLLVNLLVLIYFTLYLGEENYPLRQAVLFNISSSIVLITFVGILIYHTCTYTAVARFFRKDFGRVANTDVENDHELFLRVDSGSDSYSLYPK